MSSVLATLARIEEILHEELVDIKNHMYALGTRVQAVEAKLDAMNDKLLEVLPKPPWALRTSQRHHAVGPLDTSC